MGNAQRLPNGNTLINWVITNAPKVTEVRPDGTKAFEMNWKAMNSKSYRVFRFPWEGMVEVPNLIVESYTDNITLIFNKFGDFYETFFDDAKCCSQILGMPLVKRANGGELVPVVAIEFWLIKQCVEKMQKVGCTVGLCEQIASGKTKRDVVRTYDTQCE